jgi:tetratricopeptide (TPR) repeat protein
VLAQHYAQSADASAALDFIDDWLETYPNDVDLLKAGAVIAEAADANAMAYQWWYRLTELLDDGKQLYEAQAHAAANLRLLGEPEEAAARLAGLHAMQADNHWVALEYARALLQSEQSAAALPVLERLSQALPTNAEVLHLTGFAAFVDERYLKAADYFELALNKGYNDHEARYWVGLAYTQAEQPKQAIVWLGTLGQGPRWDSAQRLIGDALLELDDWDDFAKHYESLQQADSSEAWRWYLAEAQSLISVQQFAKAIVAIDKAVAADPDDTEVRYQRGLLLIEVGRLDEAMADLQYVIDQSADNAEAMNALGYLLIDRLGDTANGLPLVKQALDLRPDSAPVMDSYGWGLLIKGELKQGLFWLQKAWTNLKDHEIGAHLGEALWLNKRRKEARRVWQEAQQLPRGHRKDKILEAYERLGITPE